MGAGSHAPRVTAPRPWWPPPVAQVTFTDACNQKKVASFSYTQKGITVDSKPDVPANLLSNGSSPSPKPNSALTTRPALAAAGAAAAALLLPVLL